MVFLNWVAMGLSSMPTPSESVLTLVLVKTALTVSNLRGRIGSVLYLLRLRSTDLSPELAAGELAAGLATEHSIADHFRSRCRPILFCSSIEQARAADCRVCLGRFEQESVVNRLPCGHFFHNACLEKWLDYHHTTCPLCRTHVLAGEDRR